MDDPARVPKRLLSLIRQSERDCWLSPISFWEVAMLASKKRLAFLPDLRTWTREAMNRMPMREATLTFEVAQRAEDLLDFGDPADTLIAATAMTYDLTLVTVDRRLKRVKGLRTLSR